MYNTHLFIKFKYISRTELLRFAKRPRNLGEMHICINTYEDIPTCKRNICVIYAKYPSFEILSLNFPNIRSEQ